MVQSQLEGSFRPDESSSALVETGSARLLAEAHSHLAQGIATNDSADRQTNKDVTRMIHGFTIDGVKDDSDKKDSDKDNSGKSERACHVLNGRTIEDGRLIPSVKDLDLKPTEAERHGATDQDRPSRFEKYLWNLCNPQK
ncbi:hypothetical protein BH11CYA1_BH11CYA1_32180 [soil metagenome]